MSELPTLRGKDEPKLTPAAHLKRALGQATMLRDELQIWISEHPNDAARPGCLDALLATQRIVSRLERLSELNWKETT